MRIVIDMQGAQTESRFRGIGRYTLGFVRGVIEHRGDHEIILAVSGLLPESIGMIRSAFQDVLPPSAIRVWYAPGPVAATHGDSEWRETAELLREAFLLSLQPDLIHICSLFEGYVDDAVTSVGRLDQRTPVTVTLHDLIPLCNPKQYLEPNPRYHAYYKRKLDDLRKAAALLSNSEATRQEGIKYLKVPDERVVNVSSGIESRFTAAAVAPEDEVSLRAKWRIGDGFVLYTGGDDDRKNLPRLVQAYGAVSPLVRQSRPLVLAGKMQAHQIEELNHLAQKHGLAAEELIFTGYVSDKELTDLYRLCTLFVFPSWHEGFGLPALEAMACGAPVIAAGTSSLPEVIGHDEALFDPFDVESITGKLTQALQDPALRARLREHGLERAKIFSWQATGKRAVMAWERLRQTHQRAAPEKPRLGKPRLAFVSPLPPERTGIADYSAELLPALAEHYEIDVVVAQDQVDDARVRGATVRDVAWFHDNAHRLDRVVYQFGNSPFHQHMLALLRQIPGTVVMHDFYLSGLISWLELSGTMPGAWSEALHEDHGYAALAERMKDPEAAKRHWPVNLEVLRHAKGIIFHSRYAQSLIGAWYGELPLTQTRVIPHLRVPASEGDRAGARASLGIAPDRFVVCSFGFVDATKQSERLLRVWLKSPLAADPRCELVFVGENHGGDYGQQMLATMRASGAHDRVKITGYASAQTYQQYLAAADLAVQLRTHSRGESSGAVLDCMNHGCPLILNANGSLAEVEDGAVWKLDDEFSDAQLEDALNTLWRDQARRHALGAHGRANVRERHAPGACAEQYVSAIEQFHHAAEPVLPILLDAVARQTSFAPTDQNLQKLAAAIALSLPPAQPCRRLFIDISATHRTELKTGIERTVRAQLLALLKNPPAGYRVEPVYLSDLNGSWHYRRARGYTLTLLGVADPRIHDDVVEPEAGDILLGLDVVGDPLVRAAQSGLFARLRDRGVALHFLVHDILPIQMPEVFPPGADEGHLRWLQAISEFDGAICVSHAVAKSLADWRQAHLSEQDAQPYRITWSHHGADVTSAAPSRGLPSGVSGVLQQLKARPTFLMVGTIEPRKGYLQVIQAFEQLWQSQVDVNLLIVGREGWSNLPEEMRRDIPQTVATLRHHVERDKRLFWPPDVSDEYLELLYSSSDCLIAASYGEGFGLPLIEAASHGLPILARDIPVFREVAGEHAHYFSASNPTELADAIRAWLALQARGEAPPSTGMPFLTWEQSARNLAERLVQG